jgi:hypothetical protein
MGNNFSRTTGYCAGDTDSNKAHDDGFSGTSAAQTPAAEVEIHECAASGCGGTVRCSGSGPKLTIFGVLLSLQH